jgi:hypothetical protein
MQIIKVGDEFRVKMSRREARKMVAYLENYLAWFQAVAVPLYAQVFAPSNTACAANADSESNPAVSSG